MLKMPQKSVKFDKNDEVVEAEMERDGSGDDDSGGEEDDGREGRDGKLSEKQKKRMEKRKRKKEEHRQKIKEAKSQTFDFTKHTDEQII